MHSITISRSLGLLLRCMMNSPKNIYKTEKKKKKKQKKQKKKTKNKKATIEKKRKKIQCHTFCSLGDLEFKIYF